MTHDRFLSADIIGRFLSVVCHGLQLRVAVSINMTSDNDKF